MLKLVFRLQRPLCTKTVENILQSLLKRGIVQGSEFQGNRNRCILNLLCSEGFLSPSQQDSFVPGFVWLEIDKIVTEFSTNKFFFKKDKPLNVHLSWRNSRISSYTISCREIGEIEKFSKTRKEIRRQRLSQEVEYSSEDLKNWTSSGFIEEVKNVKSGHPDPHFVRKLKNRYLRNPEDIDFLQNDIADLSNWIDHRLMNGTPQTK